MADTEFKDLTALAGTDLASGDSLLVLDATGNVTKRILISEIIATQAEAEAGTEAQRFMNPLRTQQFYDAQVQTATVLASVTASGASTLSLTDTHLNTTDYDFYGLHLERIIPGTDGTNLYARVSTGGTFNSGASDYAYQVFGDGVGVSAGDVESAAAAQVVLNPESIGNAAGEEGWSGTIFLHNMAEGSYRTRMTIDGGYRRAASGVWMRCNGSAEYTTAEANDGFQIRMSSGTISGRVTVVGYAYV